MLQLLLWGDSWDIKEKCWTPTGSVVSLIAGLFFGSVSAYGAFRISNDPQDYWTSLMSAGVLAVVMGMRFRKSGKLMPAGIMAALSLLMVFRILIF
ncbi:transmembrane protein 14A-like isoform X3 [Rhinichthys klamathensis goyatoka]|nr:transmembrane protein 14A-like isoform X3 [Rhinichthys klamathensis goyatoka]